MFFMESNVLSWINYDPLVILYNMWSSNGTLDLDDKSFNFMDGMDGLTCIQVLLLAILTNLLSVLVFSVRIFNI